MMATTESAALTDILQFNRRNCVRRRARTTVDRFMSFSSSPQLAQRLPAIRVSPLGNHFIATVQLIFLFCLGAMSMLHMWFTKRSSFAGFHFSTPRPGSEHHEPHTLFALRGEMRRGHDLLPVLSRRRIDHFEAGRHPDGS